MESDQDRHIVAIENKTVGYSPEHLAQVCGYAKELSKKYPEYTLHNVLLTTSREAPVFDVAGACGPDVPKNLRITHVSWSDVGARIEELHNAGAFEREEVAAFVRQYLVAVGRLIGPQEHDDHYFRKLLSGHQSLLRHMFGVLVNDGDDKVGEAVPDRHAHYRATVVRLVRDFGQEPERLREAVRQMLTDRRMKTSNTGGKGKSAFWLSWDAVGKAALGIEWRIRWVIEFRYREVRALLEVYIAWPRGTGESATDILMRETQVNRGGHREAVLSRWKAGNLPGLRRTRIPTKRIGDYFKCLAGQLQR